MEVSELDIALEELETRVERLRSLYEQYFMGIEKIPPHVVQKDVDRRLYLLRRTQIRNTAKRFKLQTIIQRYNTFQQYWMRILREIENGTYRRHVLRAEKTVGIANLLTAAERKRLGLPEPTSAPAESDEATSQRPSIPPPENTEPSPSLKMSPSAVRSQIERELGFLLDDESSELPNLGRLDFAKELDDPLSSTLPPAARKRRVSMRAPSRRSAALGPERQAPPPSKGPERATPSSRGTAPEPPSSKHKSLRAPPPRPLLPVPSAVGGRGLPPPQSAVAGRGLPPAPKRLEPPPSAGPGVPAPEPRVKPPPLPPRAVKVAEPPRTNTVQPIFERPVPPRMPQQAQPGGTLDRASIERVAQKLTQARAQMNDSSPVIVDALAKKLEAAASDLQKKHVGRRIDFDVVIKDGKAVVKPIVR